MTSDTKNKTLCFLISVLNEIYQEQEQFKDSNYKKIALNLNNVDNLKLIYKEKDIYQNIFATFGIDETFDSTASDLSEFLKIILVKLTEQIENNHNEIVSKLGIPNELPKIKIEDDDIQDFNEAIQFLNEKDYIPKFYYLNQEIYPRR